MKKLPQQLFGTQTEASNFLTFQLSNLRELELDKCAYEPSGDKKQKWWGCFFQVCVYWVINFQFTLCILERS